MIFFGYFLKVNCLRVRYVNMSGQDTSCYCSEVGLDRDFLNYTTEPKNPECPALHRQRNRHLHFGLIHSGPPNETHDSLLALKLTSLKLLLW